MPDPRPHPGLLRWLRLPRPTARLRLTVLYGAAFLVCGAAVLTFTFLFYGHLAHISNDGRQTAQFSLHQAAQASGQPENVRLDEQAAAASDAAFQAQLNAALQQASDNPAVHSLLQKAKKAETQAAQWQVNYDVKGLLIGSAIAMSVIAVAAAGIGWLIAGRVLRPLSTITAAARRISASSLDERLALHGPDDELKELGDTLDSLFARLEASFDAQRHFAASASHELRTPLTRERTLLQVALADPNATVGTWQAVGRELLASNDEQEHLVEALLTLASSEGGAGERELLDLAAIASAALTAHPTAGRLDLRVQADIQPAVLDGEPLLIQQLVINLIDNAVRHNIAAGDIRVATWASDGRAVLSVANSGQVIPAAEVDRLFQPFQRLGARPARRNGGHGLGLSIVRAIVTAHAGTVTAQPRAGGGMVIDVTFPRPRTGRKPAGHLTRV